MLLTLPDKGEALSVILKLPGEVCNLNCHYCYEKRKPNGRFSVLSPDLLRNLFQKANDRPLSLELHGGEPLVIGKEKMRALLKECQKYKGYLRVVLQTNATLLDKEWLDLFKDEWPSIEFSTSIDGDYDTTIHRVDYKDNNVHQQIEKVFDLFDKNNMKLGVICTVTRTNLLKAQETLDYFLQFSSCLNLLKINPCFDFNAKSKITEGNKSSFLKYNPDGQGIPGWGIRPLEYSGFLKEFFDIWSVSEAFQQLLVEPFLSIIRVLGGMKSNFCIYDSQKCASMLTLYPDGRLGSCDELDMPESLLIHHLDEINSLDEVVHYQTNVNLHTKLNDLLQKCTGCSYQNTCNGGCLATRKRYKGSDLYEEYCQYRMEVIEHVKDFLEKERSQIVS